jgi:hypothetical protein
MPLGQKIRDGIWSFHAMLEEFIMYRDEDMNLSLFFLHEFCTLKEQELGRISYMKDAVPDEGIPTKLNSYFLTCILFSINFQTSKMDKYKTRKSTLFFFAG